jgi:hypothetical protein
MRKSSYKKAVEIANETAKLVIASLDDINEFVKDCEDGGHKVKSDCEACVQAVAAIMDENA